MVVCHFSTGAISNIINEYRLPDNARIFLYARQPPSMVNIITSESDWWEKKTLHKSPFYGNREDVPDISIEWNGLNLKPPSDDVCELPEFSPVGLEDSVRFPLTRKNQDYIVGKIWAVAAIPPKQSEATKWAEEKRVIEEMAEEQARIAHKKQSKISQVCVRYFTYTQAKSAYDLSDRRTIAKKQIRIQILPIFQGEKGATVSAQNR